MRKTHLWRSFAAVATAVACVAVMASPAAATTHDADLTEGLIEFSKTGVYEAIDLAALTCTPAPTLELDVTGTAVSITDLDMTSKFLFPSTVLTVFTRFNVGNTAGTLSGTTVTPLRVGVLMTFYSTTSCTPTGTPICSMAFLLQLSGSLTGTTTSDTFGLHGASVGTVVTVDGCPAGISYFIGTSAVVSNWPGFTITGHLTS